MDERRTPPPQRRPMDELPRFPHDSPSGEVALANDHEVATGGRTTIADPAVAKVAAIAARKVPGVYSLGTGTGRALGAIRDAVGGSDLSQGVQVEVGETQVAVDIVLVAEYGHPLTGVADQVRAAVYHGVQELAGLQVIEVNVEITDVHVPGLNDPKSPDKSRTAG
ncbi:Asp23/Gls24 family envelope stress response protein [Arthrobacter sp. CAN_C5]|uniref:Asp23/Gls24 family envelope stress response protein n=1 Tax=Arthrobacter sp. CAN_C5 TaxID=2760706 RepID=UPI001AEB40F3|nr:Asp23/Gls24 family envelope stress response protein [Arthrobacter sp. CAN_C5]MBP2218367.1 putative alkaline shock family protein YloU [Arthrobacter sp. CAN_C5]